ncbi:MAG TPA: hypothetical protein VMT30_06840 [Candidatus Saccharimonadia bacterium]|nr:hypothetical protein [Candidatus Saccharimonadia bacterium]
MTFRRLAAVAIVSVATAVWVGNMGNRDSITSANAGLRSTIASPSRDPQRPKPQTAPPDSVAGATVIDFKEEPVSPSRTSWRVVVYAQGVDGPLEVVTGLADRQAAKACARRLSSQAFGRGRRILLASRRRAGTCA